ncbi:hypothetical protein [Shiella aurantiaca]|uniref:hypothetical protein n=1 Tax=Shiella aurantiaca TaxID=3058365 RepID=UPI0029F55052|nr:hypothetical protein [Shiella aurantiaca]
MKKNKAASKQGSKPQLLDILIFSNLVAFFVIGVHQTFVLGFSRSYWIFMLVISLLLLYNYRKNQSLQKSKEPTVRSKKK